MGLIGKKILRKGWGNGKEYLLESFLRYLRNVNLLFKKNSKSAEFLTKASFFLYFRDRPKMVRETSRGDVESIRAKVTKHIKKGGESWSWSELTMNNWLCLSLILYLYRRKIKPIWYQYQCSHWFHDFLISCSIYSKSTKSMRPNGGISTEWAKVFSLVWEKVLFYTEAKFSY